MSNWHSIPVIRFCVCDDDEGTHEAANPRSFDDTVALLEKLREENPAIQYDMFAEVDA